MPKSFEERCQAAIQPSSRGPDVRSVLVDLENRVVELTAKAQGLRALSLDPETAPAAALSARHEEADATFAIERLEAFKPRLEERLSQIEENDRKRAEDEGRSQLVARTSALADRLRDRWPVLIGELIEILGELEENSEAVERANRGTAQHARIVCAEFQARGVEGPVWPNLGGWVERLFNMRIPELTGPRVAWPIDKHQIAMAKVMADEHAQILAAQAARTPAAIAAAKRREEARWTRYRVSQKPYRGHMVTGIGHREGTSSVAQDPVTLWMHAGQRAKAEEMGLHVEPLEKVQAR
ncbi:hypothetical protein [Sphingomonas sp.]|uniref:hypothetical protein n=1 Tax=Sphingomonas sp. TaxID=28214 RepID=UPI0025F44704|nr:hypothetical protein [Sphingomonas sp.]MBV9528334.1 hypothetical protein [Sphingomonas sp.]